MPPANAVCAVATVSESSPATVIRAVRAWRLPPQPNGLPQGLPPEVQAAASDPAGPSWSEHRDRFALCLAAEGGTGWAGPVSAVVLQVIKDDHAAGLIGHDATAHRCLPYRTTTGRHRSGPHARAAASTIEVACWDLHSRASGSSITGLLGGPVRSRVPAYASALGLDPTHPAAAETAAWITQVGFWGQKWPLPKALIAEGPRAVARLLGRLRDAAGDGHFMIDGLCRCRADDALALMPVLASLSVTWAEELVPAGSQGWQRIRASPAAVPLAAGEHVADREDQARLLASGAIDIWQPDAGWCGGISRALHTIDVAADLGIPAFPHGSALNASLAVAAACCRDKVPAVEWHLTVEPLRQQVHHDPLTVSGGGLASRASAGLSDGLKVTGKTPEWAVGQ
ncbi:MAG: enolase C-terminal domain-like protein [Streptosporangiaceae bacterium]